MEVKKGDKVLINSTLLAEPLVREVFRQALPSLNTISLFERENCFI
jgi:hypothetical protein